MYVCILELGIHTFLHPSVLLVIIIAVQTVGAVVMTSPTFNIEIPLLSLLTVGTVNIIVHHHSRLY